MQSSNEYHKFIKSQIESIYQAEINKLNNKYDIYINDEINDVIIGKENTEHAILVLNYNQISDITEYLYEKIKKISKDYIILEISFNKIKDNIYYSQAFFVSIFIVKNNIYNENIDIYKQIFKNKISKTARRLNKMELIKKLDDKYNIKINDLCGGLTSMKFDDIYNHFINKIIKHKKEINFRLNVGRFASNTKKVLTGKKIVKFDYKNNKLNNLELKDNINIDHEQIDYIRNRIVNSNVLGIVVLSIKDKNRLAKYVDVFSKANFFVIKINDNTSNHDRTNVKNYVEVESHLVCNCILNGMKALYIVNESFNKDKISKYGITIYDSEIEDINEKTITSAILKDELKMQIFANLDNVNSIKVLTSTFLNFEGTNYYSGGAERYLIDLYEVCSDLGYKLRIYQKGNYEFMRYYENIEVVGLSNNLNDFDYCDSINIKNNYDKIAEGTTNLNVYSALMECMGEPVRPSIGISHGVAWDSKYNDYTDGKQFWNNNKWIIDSAKACDKIVSVDTNTPNWFQTIDFKLGNSMSVIPNYVDIEEFYPINDKLKVKDKIILTYPRRIYEARGMYLLLDVIDDILNKYKNIEIHFVGKGFKEDTDKVNEKIAKWGERIKLYNLPPNKMHEMYKYTDISVIPTLYSEGTSLSCLEAMASGNAVISTRIGGLTDLIINNYNGKLVEPNSKSLYDAICDFMDNSDIMEKCKKNAVEVAKEFNKKHWKNKWKEVIKEMIGNESPKLKNIEYKFVKIYLQDNYDFNNISNLVLNYLKNNYVVYIITKSNINKKNSFGRLQYVSLDQELYRKPDYVIASNSMKSEVEEKVDEYLPNI